MIDESSGRWTGEETRNIGDERGRGVGGRRHRGAPRYATRRVAVVAVVVRGAVIDAVTRHPIAVTTHPPNSRAERSDKIIQAVI